MADVISAPDTRRMSAQKSDRLLQVVSLQEFENAAYEFNR
jgi:hypothetical protein